MRPGQWFTTILPSMIAGGLVFGSAFSHAGDDRTPLPPAPPAAPKAPPTPPTPPAPPAPPAPHTAPTPPTPPTPPWPPGPHGTPGPHGAPMPPMPPMPPMAHRGSGINISIHDGKVEIDGVKELVDRQLDTALDSLKNAKGVPPEVREKLEKRLSKLRDKLGKRLNHLDASDVDQLGEELGKMGEDIGQEMEDFGSDMDKWGKDFSKQFGKNFSKQFKGGWKGGNFNVHVDNSGDDDDDIPSAPDPDDAEDLDEAVSNLGDLNLKPAQHDAIQKIRTDSDQQVATAKKALATASDHLKQLLDNPNASDAEVTKSIDTVSQLEAQIRKARIIAWMNARRVLEDAQRKKVQDAAKKTK